MSPKKGFDPRIGSELSEEDGFMEEKIKNDTEKDGKFKNLMQRPDFPLFLLGGFILVLLLFILIKLPGETIDTKNETVLRGPQVEELKKALNDIRNEIVEIRYGLSAKEDSDSAADFVIALNRLEERFDKRFSSLEKTISNGEKRVVQKENLPAKTSSGNKYTNKKPVVNKKAKKVVKAKKIKSFYHVVKKGDTLYRISKKYNVPVGDIRSWNKMKNSSIHPGEKILIKN